MMKDLKYIKGFNEANTSDVTLQEIMNDFYDEYESSYIDINTHGVIVRLIKTLKDNGLLIGGNWDDTLSGEQ